ncbi:hypothetical protein R3P38DRAFT_2775747 [Favolaschia claudopus]|uniref:Uncharacterized protein n=1 Tax=Favolaschia claudopus TaxID=2862362 RepID=A0AAW0BRG2_9AGAR
MNFEMLLIRGRPLLNIRRELSVASASRNHFPIAFGDDGADGVQTNGGEEDKFDRNFKVRAALEYKIAHDPDYADLGAADEESLSQLPENGRVINRMHFCRDLGDGAPQAVGPTDAADNNGEENSEGASIGGILNLANSKFGARSSTVADYPHPAHHSQRQRRNDAEALAAHRNFSRGVGLAQRPNGVLRMWDSGRSSTRATHGMSIAVVLSEKIDFQGNDRDDKTITAA